MLLFKKNLSALFFALLIALMGLFSLPAQASENNSDNSFNPGDLIMHHVTDAHSWHLWDGHFGTIPLPIILYSKEKGIEVFSSSNFYDESHQSVAYNGYKIDHEHITAEAGFPVTDLSVTKNVASLIIIFILITYIFLSVAKGYKKNEGKAPKGIQSFFEPIIVFVRDEIVKPNIGPKYEKYLPYLLTLFFFIWFGNILGLTPGAANLTGNIAVTAVLAIITLVLTLFSSNRYFWGHIFNPPGVPWWLKPIMIPVEVIGIFTKPFSLMLRLFVAITAGHIVILSLLSMTFIFQSIGVGFVSSLVVLFINLIEILVASIQAYVFTLFSSMYIGMAMEEHH